MERSSALGLALALVLLGAGAYWLSANPPSSGSPRTSTVVSTTTATVTYTTTSTTTTTVTVKVSCDPVCLFIPSAFAMLVSSIEGKTVSVPIAFAYLQLRTRKDFKRNPLFRLVRLRTASLIVGCAGLAVLFNVSEPLGFVTFFGAVWLAVYDQIDRRSRSLAFLA